MKTTDSVHDFAPVNGADIHYEAAGDGPALVLLHAGIADMRMWGAQMSTFADTHRVIRYDLRGYGQSAMPAGSFAHHDDLKGLLRQLGVSSAIIAGASFGGRVGIDFPLEYPELVDALVLVGAALGGCPFSAEMDVFEAEIEAAHQAGDYDRAAEVDIRVWVDGPRRTAEQVDSAFRRRAHELARGVYETMSFDGTPKRLDPPANERLRELRVPTLIVTGDLDQPDIVRIAERIANNVRGARSVTIPDAAHLPSMEQPEQFNAILREFLDRLD
ncbi:MAG: alpha/beta fold hydrolase [Vicinamibacterales bacterium]